VLCAPPCRATIRHLGEDGLASIRVLDLNDVGAEFARGCSRRTDLRARSRDRGHDVQPTASSCVIVEAATVPPPATEVSSTPVSVEDRPHDCANAVNTILHRRSSDMFKVLGFLTKREGIEMRALIDYYENRPVDLRPNWVSHLDGLGVMGVPAIAAHR
jgi:hypothetical protein